MKMLVIANSGRRDDEEYIKEYVNKLKKNIGIVYPNTELDIINLSTDLAMGKKLETLSAISNIDYDRLIVDSITSVYAHGMFDNILSDYLMRDYIDYEDIKRIVHDIESL